MSKPTEVALTSTSADGVAGGAVSFLRRRGLRAFQPVFGLYSWELAIQDLGLRAWGIGGKIWGGWLACMDLLQLNLGIGPEIPHG